MDQVLKMLPAPLARIFGNLLAGDGANARSKRGALTAFAIRVASAGILFFSHVVLARWLGTFEFGVYTYVWVWVHILGILCGLGFATSVVRFVPEYTERGELDHARGFLHAGRGITVTVGLAYTVAGLVLLFSGGDWVDDIYRLPAALALLSVPALGLTDFQDGVGRSQSWMGLALAPPYILRPLLLFGFIGIAFVLGWPQTAATAAIALIGACWVTAIVQYLLQRHYLAKPIPSGGRQYRLKLWIAVSLPVLMMEGFALSMLNMDILLLDLFVEPDQIAIYFATARTITLIAFVHFAVSAAVMPRFAAYYANGDHDAIHRLLSQSRLWTLVPSLAGAVIVIALGKPLLWLFGSEFTAGYPLMFVLVVGLLARSAVGPAQGLLVVSGQQNIATLVLSGAVIANIVLNLVLIPRFGLMGAAMATSIAYGLESVALYFIVRRTTKPSIKEAPHVSPAE